MWHQKQNNEMFSSRVMGPLQYNDPHDGNSKLPAPSGVSDRDFLAESSRKRKAEAMDYAGNATPDVIYQSVIENCWPNESNQPHRFGDFARMNEPGNAMRRFSNQTPSSESGVKVFQSERDQSQGVNSYSLNLQINDEKMIDSHSSTQPQAFHQIGRSALLRPPVRMIPTLSGPQSISYNIFSQIEAHMHPYRDPNDTSVEKAFSGLGKDSMNFGNTNHIPNDNSLLDFRMKSSDLSSSLEVSQPNDEVFKHDVNLDRGTCIDDVLKNGPAIDMKQRGQALEVEKSTGVSIISSSLGSACAEENKTEQFIRSYNSEVRTGSPINRGASSQMKLNNHNGGDSDSQIMERKEGSHVENENHSLRKDILPKNADTPTQVLTGHGHGDDLQLVSHNLDGNSKSLAEKVNSITEKLWDGSLQLSASVTVSAVSFFKSGEKAPDVKWSKSIVVKGKVRLEAFEKFIQELPRSRSRGLMVISLCWKVGSSKTALSGMKEVAKGYKEEEKVGFAQPSRGIDLYVCPRSDIIITILAKYGFFKGMAALEDTKRNKNKISPSPEQPLNLTSNPVIPLTAKDNTPTIHLGENSSPLSSKVSSAPLDIPVSKGTENRPVSGDDDNNEDEDLPEFDFGNSCAVSQHGVSKSPVPSSSTHVSNAVPLEMKVSAEGVQPMGIANQQRSQAMTFSVVSGASPSKGFGEGLSLRPALSYSDEKLLAQGKEPSVQPVVGNPAPSIALPAPNNLWDDGDDMPEWCPPNLCHQSRPATMSTTRPSIPCTPSSVINPKSENKLPGQPPTMATTMPAVPYISPPVFNHNSGYIRPGLPPRMATTRPSFTYMLSPVPRKLEHMLPGPPPLPPLPPPPPPLVFVRPQFQNQGLSHGYQSSKIISTKPAQIGSVDGLAHVGLRSSMGFTSNSNLRPQVNRFDMKPPIRPAGWSGWRP
ncbi:hypothetical protein IFM89_022487 [Coptis chinensis]|uniref:Spen paralogue and orthologue SPOC C-terminal domain-containing protein n=1 Tax=Coptis chinensis TaxID=261450 RepID=A0A835IC06_9MAGN|nr:hypothetical protein IFM89_022487 [Coptis chinensis]